MDCASAPTIVTEASCAIPLLWTSLPLVSSIAEGTTGRPSAVAALEGVGYWIDCEDAIELIRQTWAGDGGLLVTTPICEEVFSDTSCAHQSRTNTGLLGTGLP